jgi:L-fucose mutarotase
MLAAILKLLPLDQYVEQPAAIMRRVPADEAAGFPVEIYGEFQKVLDSADAKAVKVEQVQR